MLIFSSKVLIFKEKSVTAIAKALPPPSYFPEWASLVAQKVKNLPGMQETQVRFLGQEDPLGKGMATHSSILAWRIPWTEKPTGLQESDTALVCD